MISGSDVTTLTEITAHIFLSGLERIAGQKMNKTQLENATHFKRKSQHLALHRYIEMYIDTTR